MGKKQTNKTNKNGECAWKNSALQKFISEVYATFDNIKFIL